VHDARSLSWACGFFVPVGKPVVAYTEVRRAALNYRRAECACKAGAVKPVVVDRTDWSTLAAQWKVHFPPSGWELVNTMALARIWRLPGPRLATGKTRASDNITVR